MQHPINEFLSNNLEDVVIYDDWRETVTEAFRMRRNTSCRHGVFMETVELALAPLFKGTTNDEFRRVLKPFTTVLSIDHASLFTYSNYHEEPEGLCILLAPALANVKIPSEVKDGPHSALHAIEKYYGVHKFFRSDVWDDKEVRKTFLDAFINATSHVEVGFIQSMFENLLLGSMCTTPGLSHEFTAKLEPLPILQEAASMNHLVRDVLDCEGALDPMKFQRMYDASWW